MRGRLVVSAYGAGTVLPGCSLSVRADSCPHSPRGTSMCRSTRPPRQDGARRFEVQSSFGARRERERRKAWLPVAIGTPPIRLRCRSGFSRDRRIPRSRLKPLLQKALQTFSKRELVRCRWQSGAELFFSPTLQRASNEDMTTNAPCAVLAGGGGQRPRSLARSVIWGMKPSPRPGKYTAERALCPTEPGRPLPSGRCPHRKPTQPNRKRTRAPSIPPTSQAAESRSQ